jgi:muramoyltetrapeptide carboxypeptidase
MSATLSVVRKPKALHPGSKLAYFAPASPVSSAADVQLGVRELQRLGFEVVPTGEIVPSGYFAGSAEERIDGFLTALRNPEIAGLVALRGGYGSTYLLDELLKQRLDPPKCVIGYSDLTAIQTFLWQINIWVTFQGPMLAGGFHKGSGGANGYDEFSFVQSVTNTVGNWSLKLRGETLASGVAEGGILGGCLTILQTSLGTPWEIDTEHAILVLEDTHIKPYQLDRVLTHLKQAGKFIGVRGFILGEFPCSEPSVANSPTVHEVCERILKPLGVPIIYGAPIGHTGRPMLTLPLGVRARLHAEGEGTLEILEPAVVE